MDSEGKSETKPTETGSAPEDWIITPVSEVAEIFLGGTPKTTIPAYWNGGIKWASAKDVSNIRSRYILKTERTITDEGVENSPAKVLPRGTIVITSRGTVGEIAMLAEPMAINQTCYGLEARGIDGIFLFYKLKSAVNQLKQVSYGAVFDTITMRTFDEIRIAYPANNAEQQAIAKILSDLDSKIELDQQISGTLEAIGQAIFNRWFVDFEFPDEECKPYKSSGGEMDSSEFGEKPHGWSTKPFSEAIAVNPPRKIEKGAIAKKVEMSDLNPWQPWIESWTKDNYRSGSRFQNGDTLFARITPCLENGKTALVSFLNTNEMAFGSTEFIVFGPKAIQSSYYILYLAISKELRASTILSMTGSSGRQRVPNDFFDDFVVAVPPNELLRKFDSLLAPMFEKITNNTRESRSLKAIRDNLLPRLMVGKIRVPIQEEIGEAQ
jgi:type I restriction enzyme S subunit